MRIDANLTIFKQGGPYVTVAKQFVHLFIALSTLIKQENKTILFFHPSKDALSNSGMETERTLAASAVPVRRSAPPRAVQGPLRQRHVLPAATRSIHPAH